MFFKKPAYDFIIAGLGNPGTKYAMTRHNAGFMALDALAGELNAKVDRLRFNALTGEVKHGGLRLFLMKPQTYMNLSGRSVSAAMRYYKLTPDRVVVLFDDVALPLGAVRVRPDGSAGGHNGIKSLIAELGTDAFPRVKIGVGQSEHHDMVDWVTSAFTPAELDTVKPAAETAARAALELCRNGAAAAAQKYNTRG